MWAKEFISFTDRIRFFSPSTNWILCSRSLSGFLLLSWTLNWFTAIVLDYLKKRWWTFINSNRVPATRYVWPTEHDRELSATESSNTATSSSGQRWEGRNFNCTAMFLYFVLWYDGWMGVGVPVGSKWERTQPREWNTRKRNGVMFIGGKCAAELWWGYRNSWQRAACHG